jgi:SAM-dependent MidA family methyltransferase
MMTQGEFLLKLGLLERAGALGADKSAEKQDEIRMAVERLAGEGRAGMGGLFKVCAVTSPKIAIQPFTNPG